jgi:hypothetical protein
MIAASVKRDVEEGGMEREDNPRPPAAALMGGRRECHAVDHRVEVIVEYRARVVLRPERRLEPPLHRGGELPPNVDDWIGQLRDLEPGSLMSALSKSTVTDEVL